MKVNLKSEVCIAVVIAALIPLWSVMPKNPGVATTEPLTYGSARALLGKTQPSMLSFVQLAYGKSAKLPREGLPLIWLNKR